MQTFKKLPVVIEAIRFETNNEPNGSPHMDSIVQWINSQGGVSMHNGTSITIQTLEGDHRADVGDWVIRGVKGEFYPCKADIFAATYELAPSEAALQMASTPASDAGETAIEAEIQRKGLTAPRLTPDAIDAVIRSEIYWNPTGTTLTICVLTLRNGFTVTGESAAASPENFDVAIGETIARKNAREKIWALEGYLLRETLSGGML